MRKIEGEEFHDRSHYFVHAELPALADGFVVH